MKYNTHESQREKSKQLKIRKMPSESGVIVKESVNTCSLTFQVGLSLWSVVPIRRGRRINKELKIKLVCSLVWTVLTYYLHGSEG